MRHVPPLFLSELLHRPGQAHLFSTAQGGRAEPQVGGCNLHYRKGGTRETVLHNRARLMERVGLDPQSLRLVDQVHGGEVLLVQGMTLKETESVPADGLVTTTPGYTVGVYVADCLPILLSVPGGVAALHGGWRSLVAGIVERGIQTLCDATGVGPEKITLAMGAGIGLCCFEVGEEVCDHFSALDLKEAIVPSLGGAKPHIDLQAAAMRLAERAGVLPHHMDRNPLCTCCEPQLFYSYRRDGWPTGHLMGIIGIR